MTDSAPGKDDGFFYYSLERNMSQRLYHSQALLPATHIDEKLFVLQ